MNPEIIKGLQLPAFDIEMLSLGKLIAVPFKQYISEGETFWLYPSQHIPFGLRLEEYYKPEYLDAAKDAEIQYSIPPIPINLWAISEYHWHIHSNNRHFLPKIAQSTIWNLSALEHIFEQFQVLKLLFLKVHRFSEPCIVNSISQPGTYFWAQTEDKMFSGSYQNHSVVSQVSFEQRKDLLIAGEVYPYTALETLQSQVEKLVSINPFSNILNHDIKQCLGWISESSSIPTTPDWMTKIAALGDRSVAEDDGKSNYQAGTDFEHVVRQSLEFLGFKVDYSHRGGAGGIDLFCSEPYPLVGECKSGKKIPNDTAVQLLNLGTIRLDNREEFSKSAKLIIGPGEPTEQLQKAAKVHGMAILNPATLEKLVKLHHQYRIDLFKLKDHLVDGQADDEVGKFIDQSIQAIKLRSHIINQVKVFLETSRDESADASQLHAIYIYSNPPQPLKREELHEILIELSSPLTGYLGRRKGTDGTDRFYFLRDLPINFTLE